MIRHLHVWMLRKFQTFNVILRYSTYPKGFAGKEESLLT